MQSRWTPGNVRKTRGSRSCASRSCYLSIGGLRQRCSRFFAATSLLLFRIEHQQPEVFPDDYQFSGSHLDAGGAAAAAEVSPAPTFNKDVLPILQKNCQTCHRPGQIAPMSFLDYKSTRLWAKAMK